MEGDLPRPDLKSWWKSLAAEQRAALLILSCCGAVILGLSVYYVQAQVFAPFMVPNTLLTSARAVLNQLPDDAKTIAELKAKDTDHDGLSDYAELYIYHTSPYLADTNGDGIPDGLSVAMGIDPNCPPGQSCAIATDAISGNPSSTALQDLLNTTKIQTGTPEVTLGANSSTAGVQAFIQNPPAPGSMDAAQTRAFLISTGLVPKDQLDQLPDDQVMSVYQAAYQEALNVRKPLNGAEGTASTGTAAGATQ